MAVSATAATASIRTVCLACICSPPMFCLIAFPLVLDVFVHPLGTDLGAIDVAVYIGGNALGGTRAGCLVHRIGDERRHQAVAHPAHADAAFPAVMILRYRFRLRVGDVDDIVLVDEHSARPAELMPLIEEVPLLVEDLDTVVAAVTEKEPTARIHRQRVRTVYLARARSLLAPRLDELAVLVELH